MKKIEELKILAKNAYAPYSKFNVAAILVMKNGEVIGGVNVENAAYPLSICAEQNAITSAIAKGYKREDFEEIHLFGGNGFNNVMPCGACRQVIYEFFDNEKKLFSYSINRINSYKIAEILPFAFGTKDL